MCVIGLAWDGEERSGPPGKDPKMDQYRKKGDTMIKELPEEERPREKMMRYGANRLTNCELLAILIGTGTKRNSALTLANSILSIEETGLAFLADCSPEELVCVEGIGMAKSCQIISAIELGKRIAGAPRGKKISLGSPDQVAALFMEEMRHRKKEVFKVLFLNTKNEIVAIEDVSVGNLNTSIVHPREVFRSAVKKGAASIILLHNHPSGNPTPSQNDIDVTRRLTETGKLLGIPVLDHLVIGDGAYLSFKEQMLLDAHESG